MKARRSLRSLLHHSTFLVRHSAVLSFSLAFLLLAGCGGKPADPAPGANEIGVALHAGAPEVRWYRMDVAALPISQIRVGTSERGATNWTIVLWDGVWKKGWTGGDGATSAPFRVRGFLPAPGAGEAARGVTVACTLTAPLRVRSALGEGFVPAGTQIVAAARSGAADGRAWAAGLPVVMTVSGTRTNGWFSRQFLSRQECDEQVYAQRRDRMETRILYINPDLRGLIRQVNADKIAKQNAVQPMHEIQAVLASHDVRFPPGAYVAEGPFTNSIVIRNTVAELNGLDPIKGKGGVLLFGQYDPWKAGGGK